MSFVAVIPARYASSRLPGKPLLDLAGKPMLQWVWERACQSDAQRVVIATDDSRIARVASDFGAEVCMTSDQHLSGTDRLQEVVTQLALGDETCLVNVQGDEPLIPAALINQVARNLLQFPEASIATLSEPLAHAADLFNPNQVKVVSDRRGRALYFSRSPIPWARDFFEPGCVPSQLPDGFPCQRHIGLYAYRAGFLHRYVTWPAADLERFEHLEQLRALWQGEMIHVEPACERHPAGIDTQADYERVLSLLSQQR